MIFYKGKSLIDNTAIVAIATIRKGKSHNKKTGNMLQTWILKDNGKSPIENSRLGLDSSVCGSCIHKGIAQPNKDSGVAKDRTCYVLLHQAPNAVWKAYMNGSYEYVQGEKQVSALGAYLDVRVGSYGDPYAVPPIYWHWLLSRANSHTGYTHQQNTLPQLLMTSADNLKDAESAWSRNERTFRVISSIDKLVKGKEILCPASKEAGERVQCAQCKLCGGNSVKGKSVAIVAHGTSKRKAKELVE